MINNPTFQQSLNEKEKEKYKEMANKAKEGEASVPKPFNVLSNAGFTAQILILPLIKEQEKNKRNELQNMKDSITKMLADGKKTGGE